MKNPKSNVEPEDEGFDKESPLPGVHAFRFELLDFGDCN